MIERGSDRIKVKVLYLNILSVYIHSHVNKYIYTNTQHTNASASHQEHLIACIYVTSSKASYRKMHHDAVRQLLALN